MAQKEISHESETPESLFAPHQSPDIDFSVDKDRRLVVVKLEGNVTVQEIAKDVESLVTHPHFDPLFSDITGSQRRSTVRSASQRFPDSCRSNRSVFRGLPSVHLL